MCGVESLLMWCTCACVVFRQAEFQWGNPAAKDAIQSQVRAAVTGPVQTAVLAAISTVVDEFMSK